MRVETRLSPSESKLVADDYQSGITVPELVKKYGISRASIYHHLAKHDAVPAKTPLTSEQIDRAILLYQADMTLVEVAKEIGSNTRTIALAMEERGVPRRPRGVRIALDLSTLNRLRSTPGPSSGGRCS